MQTSQLLRARGLRATPMRKAVLDHLSTQAAAVGLGDIVRALAADRVTVYRTLGTFEEHGIVHRIVDGTQQDKYALCGQDCSSSGHHHDHAHFHCDDCGLTECLEVPATAPTAVLPKGYTASSVLLTLNGRCAACQS